MGDYTRVGDYTIVKVNYNNVSTLKKKALHRDTNLLISRESISRQKTSFYCENT